ncbi:hypothetical protein K435DRAFT_868657 [Dendrothele bispora CBS 962.96]|uniref:Uncharacterized protein n=1 Tax=Dendrothele bispora (strain CBS 962.96) TaxID=1314807 RepID=A0A4S8LB53_DENBC|nr:hypothetical protein K435DRAFT_868657 [Dendrothele bispora CBS 962.96]
MDCSFSIQLSRADMVFKHRHGRPLRRLMLLIIETGAASATLATTGTVLLCIGASPFDQISQRSLGIFYSNTILVIFNSRMRIKSSKEDMQLALAVSFAVEEGLRTTTLNAETRTGISYEGPAEPIISSRFEVCGIRTRVGGSYFEGRSLSEMLLPEIPAPSRCHLPRSLGTAMVDNRSLGVA